MKKIFYLALIITLVILSCEKTPEALFHTENAEPEVGQEVFFINDSRDADEFDWDFGDGYGSSDENPVHIFTGTGAYTVTLTAFSKNGDEDQAVMTIDVMIPTLLEVEVLEYFEKYPVANASVILYATLTDWNNEASMVSEAIADDDGFAVFSHLEPFVYYADVWEETHNNYTLADEDVGFIRTPEIMPHKINRFIAYVDKVQPAKGFARRDAAYVIRKIERKASEVNQVSAGSGTNDWKELYARSVKLK